MLQQAEIRATYVEMGDTSFAAECAALLTFLLHVISIPQYFKMMTAAWIAVSSFPHLACSRQWEGTNIPRTKRLHWSRPSNIVEKFQQLPGLAHSTRHTAHSTEPPEPPLQSALHTGHNLLPSVLISDTTQIQDYLQDGKGKEKLTMS